MRLGNLNGLGSVYDRDGRPILDKGERLIQEVSGDNLLVLKGKGRLKSETLIDMTKEKGTLYLTDRRLIFLRKPNQWKRFYTYGNPLGMGTAFSEAAYARDLEEAGALEYFELPYREVEGFKGRKSKWTDLHLRDPDGTPIRVMLERRDRRDEKLAVLEELLLEAGAIRH